MVHVESDQANDIFGKEHIFLACMTKVLFLRDLGYLEIQVNFFHISHVFPFLFSA